MQNKHVANLNLSKNEIVNQTNAKSIGKFLLSTESNCLTQVSLSNCKISNTTFSSMLMEMKKQSKLPTQSSGSTLERLDLSFNGIKSSTMRMFVQVMISCFHSLTHLNLSNNLY